MDETDIAGRVARYVKTHGPFTADQMIAELGLDAVQGVRMLDELHAKGELLKGHFVDDAAGADANGSDDSASERSPRQTPQQWLHKDVFRRIRALSLAKARKAIKPVEPAVYQAFLLDRQGVGPVGGARYEGVDGLMRVIEQLEGIYLNTSVWESSVFPARVRDYQPSMLDELLASGDVVWVGSKINGSNAKEAGGIAFHPADSRLLTKPGEQSQNNAYSAGTMTVPETILAALSNGGAFHARQLSTAAKAIWQEHAEVNVNPETGEIILPAWGESQFEEALWSLVWQGKVTNSSFAPRSGLGSRHGFSARHALPHADACGSTSRHRRRSVDYGPRSTRPGPVQWRYRPNGRYRRQTNSRHRGIRHRIDRIAARPIWRDRGSANRQRSRSQADSPDYTRYSNAWRNTAIWSEACSSKDSERPNSPDVTQWTPCAATTRRAANPAWRST